MSSHDSKLIIWIGSFMYTIEYNKELNANKGVLKNIKSISIDEEDILMMKNIDILHGGNKSLFGLYLKYLIFSKKNKNNNERFTILNNGLNNAEVISNIILCDWLINEKSLSLNKEEYLRRKELCQDAINYLSGSNRSYDKKRCILMQYFIDTLDKNLEKDKSLIK